MRYHTGQFAQAYQDPTHAILSVWIDMMLLNREDESFCSMCPANRDVYTKPDPTLPVTYYERLHERV